MIGTIALDIDGTITDENHLIPDEVAYFFKTISDQGWVFIFVTGRPFSFAMHSLPKLSFPYFLGVQNGSVLFEMPDKKELERNYLSLETIKRIDEMRQGKRGDLLVYSGYERGDACYFRPDRFSKRVQAYLKKVETVSDRPWIPVEAFDLTELSSFPLVKCFGTYDEMHAFQEELETLDDLKVSLIKDIFCSDTYLLLITHKEVDKGVAVKKFIERFSLQRPLITGGDDNNDLPFVKDGDARIVMEGAPKPLLEMATVIAPPSRKHGIIEGLKKAMEALS